MIADWDSRNKDGNLKIRFSELYPLSAATARFADGAVGVYFLGIADGLGIGYPFKKSRLIYIGMSASRQNSIGKRLQAHLSGRSGNVALFNYAKVRPVVFSYFGNEVLSALGVCPVPEIEGFFLREFESVHGAYPICNNQSSAAGPASALKHAALKVDWTAWNEVDHTVRP
jgi:hypothetical protein